MENSFGKKPRILCLHGHGASAKILQEEMKRWPEFVLEMMDLVYIDAPFPLEGKSGNEGKFDPPYYEWFQAYENFTVYKNFDECIAYIEEQMIKLGPFDGVLGVSQGGVVAAALPGMQRERVALTRVPRIKFVVLISGAKLGGLFLSAPELAKNAFSSPIAIPSLHIIGEKDEKISHQFELLGSFVHPTLLYHHEGHGVPHLDRAWIPQPDSKNSPREGEYAWCEQNVLLLLGYCCFIVLLGKGNSSSESELTKITWYYTFLTFSQVIVRIIRKACALQVVAILYFVVYILHGKEQLSECEAQD